ncbi:ATP-binding protein [Anthocerotibacter panamensis]|uniref:ATP-binding protein n=1 Tax=Anthocerotibacter panamensis TaxID=2857077 RepID=UPI001C408164|nr:ATP-binding protein [Anthocerotibacter panamensis]
MESTRHTSQSTANTDYLMALVISLCEAIERYHAYRQGRVPEPISDAEANLNALAASMSPPPAFEEVSASFGLSLFERTILAMSTAWVIHPNFAGLCATVQANPKLSYPTFNLAFNVFSDKQWSALTPQAPLRRWHLITLGPGQPISLCPIYIDECILHYLCGEPYQDQQLLSKIQPLPGDLFDYPLQPTHDQIARRLTATWNNLHTLPIIQLCGSEVADKWAIARHACTRLKRPLKVLSSRRLPTDSEELHQLIRRWEREAILTRCVLLLDCDQHNTGNALQETALAQFLQETTALVILSSEERLCSLRRPMVTFDIPKLTPEEQQVVWQTALGPIIAQMNGQVEHLVAQFNLSTPAIQTASLEAQGQPEPETALWEICRSLARPRLDDLAQRIEASASWEDLVLPDAPRQVLEDLAAHLRQRTKVYQEWGFAKKGSRGLGISAMFAGASGTGKTMAAEVLARELRLDLYRIDLSAVVSKYIGETEKNLRRIFDAAEAGGAILLFDEADALFGKRTQVKDSHDRHANVEVSYLLQRVEAYQGLAILTTNLKDSVDTAFLRRIRFVVTFSFPNLTQRAEIWQRVFPTQTPTEGLDMKKLARLNVAGGNIRNIAMNAAFIAADAGEPVMMKHILLGVKREYLKLDKTLTEAEVQGWV